MTKSTRREFLRQAATAAAGAYGLSALAADPILAAGEKPAKSRVIIATDPKMQKGEGSFDGEAIKTVLNRGIVSLTGAKSPEAAWKKLFKPTDVVGIKVNCIAGRGCSTRPEVAMAVAAGLQLAGVKPDNIIIWDRNDRELINVGYTLCQDPGKVQVYGVSGDWDEVVTTQGIFRGKLAKILSTKITALVNVPILKDHGGAGITLAMKNHYGSISNPGPLHGNNCDPGVADVNAVPVIGSKTRLIVGDAIRALANGGPGNRPKFIWDCNSLLIGTDPVAMDYQGWQIIEARRKEIGLPTLEGDGRAPTYIATAATRGLGTNDPLKIEVVKV